MNPDLDQILKTWKVDAQSPARFHADVWERIAGHEAERERSLSYRIAGFLALLGRPRPALAFAVMMLFAGISTAHFEAQRTNADLWRSLQTRYTTSIDPTEHLLAMR